MSMAGPVPFPFFSLSLRPFFITKVVSSNSVQGEVYLIQHYVIKFVSDLWQAGGFLRVLRFPRYSWNIVESGVKHHKPKPISQLNPYNHCHMYLRSFLICSERNFEDTKGLIRSRKSKVTTIAERKRTQGQTMIYIHYSGICIVWPR